MTKARPAPRRTSRRRLAVSLAVAAMVLGVLLCVGAVSVLPHAGVYLTGLSLGLVGLVSLSILFLRRWRMALAVAGTVSLVVAAVVVPLHLADQDSRVDAEWSVNLASPPKTVHVEANRVLVADSEGLTALSPTGGNVLWQVDGFGDGFEVSADEYVLAQSDGPQGSRSIAWVDPDGTVLWQWDETAAQGNWTTNVEPVAAVGESLVISTCEGTAEDRSCVFTGIDAHGQVRWDVEGVGGPGSLGLMSSPAPMGSPEVLPTMLVHGIAPGDPRAVVRDPVTGDVMHEFEVPRSDDRPGARWPGAAVSDGVLIYQEGPAEADGLCVWRGWDAGGNAMWIEKLPCLDNRLVVADKFAYGQYRADGDDSSPSWALDVETGSWVAVGELDPYHHRHDETATAADPIGLPGPGLVVQRAGDQLVALDSRTGETSWAISAAGPVDVSQVGSETVVARVPAAPSRNPFVSSTQVTEYDTVILDAHTGSITGRIGPLPQLSWIAAAPSGTAVVAYGSTLSLVGNQL